MMSGEYLSQHFAADRTQQCEDIFYIQNEMWTRQASSHTHQMITVDSRSVIYGTRLGVRCLSLWDTLGGPSWLHAARLEAMHQRFPAQRPQSSLETSLPWNWCSRNPGGPGYVHVDGRFAVLQQAGKSKSENHSTVPLFNVRCSALSNRMFVPFSCLWPFPDRATT